MSTSIADSTPLIHLARVGDLNLLRDVTGPLLIPPAVFREVMAQGATRDDAAILSNAIGDWISVSDRPDQALCTALSMQARLGAGESEAIVLAQSVAADLLVMDDQAAVGQARLAGITVVRTPTIYCGGQKSWADQRA